MKPLQKDIHGLKEFLVKSGLIGFDKTIIIENNTPVLSSFQTYKIIFFATSINSTEISNLLDYLSGIGNGFLCACNITAVKGKIKVNLINCQNKIFHEKNDIESVGN